VPQVVHSVGRRLPNGWTDLFRQIVLFVAAYQGYQVVRGIARQAPESEITSPAGGAMSVSQVSFFLNGDVPPMSSKRRG